MQPKVGSNNPYTAKVYRMELDATGNAICQINGNGDIYGMGVRLGIYF